MDVVTLRIYLRHRQSVWSDVKILCSFIQHRWFDWWGYRFSVTVLIKRFRWNGFNVILTIKLFELARGFRLVVRHCAGDLDWCLRWLRGQLGHGKTIFAREEGMQLIVHKNRNIFYIQSHHGFSIIWIFDHVRFLTIWRADFFYYVGAGTPYGRISVVALQLFFGDVSTQHKLVYILLSR